MKGNPYPEKFWNKRYAQDSFVYGTNPNLFFKQQLDKLKPGRILLPADGEGRNAVYAAQQGWDVTAFDISEVAMEKAMSLASSMNVTINYEVCSVLNFESSQQFNVIALCYAHFPAAMRFKAHEHLMNFIDHDGAVVFEAFAKAQLNYKSGGPKNIEMLYSLQEVDQEFTQLKFSILEEKVIQLNEGDYHQGDASVVRFVGSPKK